MVWWLRGSVRWAMCAASRMIDVRKPVRSRPPILGTALGRRVVAIEPLSRFWCYRMGFRLVAGCPLAAAVTSAWSVSRGSGPVDRGLGVAGEASARHCVADG